MASSRVGSEGCIALATSLHTSSCLTCLDLSDNPTDSEVRSTHPARCWPIQTRHVGGRAPLGSELGQNFARQTCFACLYAFLSARSLLFMHAKSSCCGSALSLSN